MIFTIRAKLITGLSASALLLACVGGFGLYGQHLVTKDLDQIVGTSLSTVVDMNELRTLHAQGRSSLVDALLNHDTEAVSRFNQGAAARAGRIKAIWSEYYPSRVDGDAEERAAERYLEAARRLAIEENGVLSLVTKGNTAEANKEYAQSSDAFGVLSAACDELVTINQAQADAAHHDAQAVAAKMKLEIIAAIIAGFMAMCTLAVALIRAISRPLDRAVALAESVADGQLNNTIGPIYRDEVGRLLEALGVMDSRLTRIVANARDASDVVRTTSGQIARGNDDLSQRTQEQASSLEETAATLEELTATVRLNANNASSAAGLTRASLKRVEAGHIVSDETRQAMVDIEASSDRISEIVALIESIAFQTNLLALNAAVEAARAGEQGRGFAVVAGEVRSLATRSAAAVRDVQRLVADSREHVSIGRALVNRTGDALQDIRTHVLGVADLVAEMAAASSQQATGIDQINLAVTQLDDVTQHNAALVDEAAAASRAMEEMASELSAQVRYFKIADRRFELHGRHSGSSLEHDAQLIPNSVMDEMAPEEV